MKNVHLIQVFGPTPPCVRAAIERGFERGEKRMWRRHRLRSACFTAASVLVLCGIGLAAIHALRPSPDRIQYAQESTQRPLTAVNFTAVEDSIAETPFASADDVATVRTLPSEGEKAQTIVLGQPEAAVAGTEEFPETPEASTAEQTSAAVMPDVQTADGANTPAPIAAGAEALEVSEACSTPEPAGEQIPEAGPTPEPLPANTAVNGTLQFHVEEAVFNDDYGFLLLRCSFDSGDWMRVSSELPTDAAFVSSSGISIAEISPVLENMLAHSFGGNNGIRFAQTAVPEVLLPDGTRPLATRITEGENGAQKILLAYSPDPRHNLPEYVNVNLYLNGFLVNDAGECLAAYSEPVPLEAMVSGTFSATGEPVTEKAGAYVQSVPVEVPVTRVRGGYAAKSGISHYWISGFGDWILFHMNQDYSASDEDLQKILDGSVILTLANGTKMTLPITCMNVEREDDSEYWQVCALLSAEECRTGDPAFCAVTTMDGEFLLSDMLETEAPLALALEKAQLTENSTESVPLPTPEPVPAITPEPVPAQSSVPADTSDEAPNSPAAESGAGSEEYGG